MKSPFDILKGKRPDLSDFVKQAALADKKHRGGLAAAANQNNHIELPAKKK